MVIGQTKLLIPGADRYFHRFVHKSPDSPDADWKYQAAKRLPVSAGIIFSYFRKGTLSASISWRCLRRLCWFEGIWTTGCFSLSQNDDVWSETPDNWLVQVKNMFWFEVQIFSFAFLLGFEPLSGQRRLILSLHWFNNESEMSQEWK